MPDSYDLILNELGYIRREVAGINTRLDKQNGRLDQVEKDVLILRHDAELEEKHEARENVDKRQEKMLKGFEKLFEKYLRPMITIGGLFYVIAKMNNWVP